MSHTASIKSLLSQSRELLELNPFPYLICRKCTLGIGSCDKNGDRNLRVKRMSVIYLLADAQMNVWWKKSAWWQRVSESGRRYKPIYIHPRLRQNVCEMGRSFAESLQTDTHAALPILLNYSSSTIQSRAPWSLACSSAGGAQWK
jgi:hypothetical protein